MKRAIFWSFAGATAWDTPSLWASIHSYYKLKHMRLIIPKQELLDNLIWILNRPLEFNLDPPIRLQTHLERKAMELMDEIGYRHSENPECESMRETILRANFTDYRFTGTDNDRHDEEYRQRLSMLREQYAGALLIIDGFDQDGKPLQELRAEEAYRDLTQIGAYLLFTTRQCPINEIEQLSKSERTVLGCAALISEQGIDTELFRDALPPGCEKAVHALRTRGWLIRDQDVMKLQPMIRAVCLQERKPSDSQCWVFLSNLWAHYTAGKSSAVQTRQMAALFTSAAQLLTDRNVLYPNRASILWRASGHLSKAKELYDNILPKYAQILKVYETELQTLYSEAADICIELGMHANALGYALKALELCKKAILSDSEACAHSYDSVGSIYAAMGSYQTALEYQLMALQTRQDIPYIDRLKLASSYENVGNTHLLLGDHREAHRHLQTALELFPMLSSPATLPVGQTYAYAGIRSFLLEDYSGAKPHIEKALDILRDYLPPGHPALLQLSFALDRILEQFL